MYVTDGGYSVSDEILDEGREGLSFFADFIPVYDEAASLAGPGRYRGITFQNDIQRPFDELRGIDFRTMRTDGEHLVSAVTQSGDHLGALDRYWGSLSGWTGTASEAAKQHRDRFNQQAGDFISKAAPAGGAIIGGVANIQSTVSQYSQAVYGMYSQTCGGMTVQDVRGAIELAKGNVDSSNAQYFLAKAGDVTAGFLTFGASWLLDYFGWGMSDMVRQQLMDAAKQRLRNFVQEFDAKKGAFDRLTRTAEQSIQQDYDTMLSALRPMTHEAFRDLPEAAPVGSTVPAGATQRPAAVRRPPTVPGAGTTPSGARPPSGAGTVQRPPTIPGSTPPQQTVPSGSIPTVPQQVPQIPGQQPGGLPGSQPGALPGTRQPGQPVTIRHGNSTITLSPPDASGRVRMSVSDGNGPPKTYDLDFGRGGTVSSGAGTVPSGGPHPLPPVTQPGGGGGSLPGTPPFAGMPGMPSAGAARPGSPGSLPSAPKLPPSMFPFSDKPAQQVHPDEDGHLVIHDGDATISVDANEAADQLSITIDDGHGHKTSYQLDYHDPAHPTLKEGPPPQPHVFGPTGSIPSTPATPHFAPAAFTPEHAGAHGGIGGGGGGGCLAAAAASGGGGAAGGQQLQPGAYTGGQVSAQPPGQTGAAAAIPGGAGAPGGQAGGMPMMGGMGAAGGQRGEDAERGPNRWLGKENVFAEDPDARRKALKAGGVIGEDKKK
jgi:hypothetical protein